MDPGAENPQVSVMKRQSRTAADLEESGLKQTLNAPSPSAARHGTCVSWGHRMAGPPASARALIVPPLLLGIPAGQVAPAILA